MQPIADELSAALESALTRFAGLVRGIGRRHRLSDADVDEVMQEVRIRLWRSGATERTDALTVAYVYRTAVSAALDLLRRRRARRVELTDDIDTPAIATILVASHGADASATATELAEQVARAVDTLAPARRPVVRMYLAGYSREEIATQLGWSEAKTRNLLYRGLADLRERLTEWGIGWEAER